VRILCISTVFPLPITRGDELRVYSLLRGLKELDGERHVLTLRRPDTSDQIVENLEREVGARVETFHPDVGSSDHSGRVALARRWSRTIAERTPAWMLDRTSTELRRRASELAPGFDCVVLLEDAAGIYAASLPPRIPVILDKQNVHGWSTAEAPTAGKPAWLFKLRHHVHLAATRSFEKRTLERCSAVSVTSKEEAVRLFRLYSRKTDAIVPSGVEMMPASEGTPGGCVVGWLGTHEVAVNVEGLLRFTTSAWAPLGADGYELHIAGKRPSEQVLGLQATRGVKVLGFVEDLKTWLASLDVAVVPLWSGAGVKLKTLTFMSASVPIVTTPVGVEGIDVEHERHCLIAEEPHELAAGLRRLLEDRVLARRLAVAARALVAERYTMPAIGAGFSRFVYEAVSRH
jgi:glycosyltransferase involved in cell wall biosynthesis